MHELYLTSSVNILCIAATYLIGRRLVDCPGTSYNVTLMRPSPDRGVSLGSSGGRSPVASDLTGRSHVESFLDFANSVFGRSLVTIRVVDRDVPGYCLLWTTVVLSQHSLRVEQSLGQLIAADVDQMS